MAVIEWEYGDKPMPLKVNMDLTGATAVVVQTDGRDDDDNSWDDHTPLVTATVTGDMTVDVSALPRGDHRIRVRVTRGSDFVATFPNKGRLWLRIT